MSSQCFIEVTNQDNSLLSLSKDLKEELRTSPTKVSDKYTFEFTRKHDHGKLEEVKCDNVELTNLSRFLAQAKDSIK